MFATLHTNHGDIRLELFDNHAPKTVANFVGLATGEKEYADPASGDTVSGKPFYDGVGFHRVIDGFMIQGGCPLGTGTGGPGYTFDDEIHPELAFTKKYQLAMANAGKRMNPITGQPGGTNGSQFFITVSEPGYLTGKHTIFGEVADDESRAVVDTIANVPTDRRDAPLEPVVIESVTVEK
ncbi:peptidylprolyl isomerase [Micrococcales bacterium 31B]|nr:peptidylprolyl isomerase [Micrococcales bacterium 31B]